MGFAHLTERLSIVSGTQPFALASNGGGIMLQRSRSPERITAGALLVLAIAAVVAAWPRMTPEASAREDLASRGEQIFRHDTFGDERLWTKRLRLHEFI
jgi:hypothetical protein